MANGTKHTPGSWRAVTTENGESRDSVWAEETHEDGESYIRLVARCYPVEEAEANATLIAAAPDLLEACLVGGEAVCSLMCPSQWPTGERPTHSIQCQQVRAAIAAATGEEREG